MPFPGPVNRRLFMFTRPFVAACHSVFILLIDLKLTFPTRSVAPSLLSRAFHHILRVVDDIHIISDDKVVLPSTESHSAVERSERIQERQFHVLEETAHQRLSRY